MALRQPLKEAWRTIGGERVPWLDGALAVVIGLLLSSGFEVLYNVVVYAIWRVTPDFGFPPSPCDFVTHCGLLGEPTQLHKPVPRNQRDRHSIQEQTRDAIRAYA